MEFWWIFQSAEIEWIIIFGLHIFLASIGRQQMFWNYEMEAFPFSIYVRHT